MPVGMAFSVAERLGGRGGMRMGAEKGEKAANQSKARIPKHFISLCNVKFISERACCGGSHL